LVAAHFLNIQSLLAPVVVQKMKQRQPHGKTNKARAYYNLIIVYRIKPPLELCYGILRQLFVIEIVTDYRRLIGRL